MLMACACSTAPSLPPQALQAQVPARLLVKPAPPPSVPRTTDPATGQVKIDGGDALNGFALLYDYIGGVVGQLDALIDAVTARDAAPEPKKHRHLF